jgi:hypothetical protein
MDNGDPDGLSMSSTLGMAYTMSRDVFKYTRRLMRRRGGSGRWQISTLAVRRSLMARREEEGLL